MKTEIRHDGKFLGNLNHYLRKLKNQKRWTPANTISIGAGCNRSLVTSSVSSV